MESMTTVGIVGRGIIGASWALSFARSGLDVRVWCRDPDQLDAARKNLQATSDAISGTGFEGDAKTLKQVSWHTDIEQALDGVDYVQESVSEDLELKHHVLRLIESRAPKGAIIGSSTSGIMPSEMVTALKHPERFLVVHPLTPPHLLPVTELCAAPQTSENVIETVRAFLTGIGHTPVLIGSEIPGFALNRLLGALLNECFALIRDGVLAPEDVDPLFTEGFGLRWGVVGPFAAMDLNAPEGVGDYLKRYGGISGAVARSRGAAPVLTDSLADRIDRAVKQQYAGQDRHSRALNRDRGIAKVRAARDSFRAEQGPLS